MSSLPPGKGSWARGGSRRGSSSLDASLMPASVAEALSGRGALPALMLSSLEELAPRGGGR